MEGARRVNTDAVRKDALEDLKHRDEDEPCMAVHAVSLLDALGFGDEDVANGSAWRKLAGRPCGDVRRLAKNMMEVRIEVRQHMLTEFAKGRPS